MEPNEETGQAFKAAMRMMASVYEKQVTDDEFETFWHYLHRYQFIAVTSAFDRYARSGERFFPKPGQIIEYIEGSNASKASMAWAKVSKAVRQFGPYSTVIFDESAIHAAIEQMGGWTKLCTSPSEEDFKFEGIRFEKIYLSVAMKDRYEYPRQLKGLGDDKPRPFGDADKCMLVYKNGGNNDRSKQLKNENRFDKLLDEATPKKLNNDKDDTK